MYCENTRDIVPAYSGFASAQERFRTLAPRPFYGRCELFRTSHCILSRGEAHDMMLLLSISARSLPNNALH